MPTLEIDKPGISGTLDWSPMRSAQFEKVVVFGGPSFAEQHFVEGANTLTVNKIDYRVSLSFVLNGESWTPNKYVAYRADGKVTDEPTPAAAKKIVSTGKLLLEEVLKVPDLDLWEAIDVGWVDSVIDSEKIRVAARDLRAFSEAQRSVAEGLKKGWYVLEETTKGRREAHLKLDVLQDLASSVLGIKGSGPIFPVCGLIFDRDSGALVGVVLPGSPPVIVPSANYVRFSR